MEWLFFAGVIGLIFTTVVPATYLVGKKDGFKLGRQEPTEITVLKEIPGPTQIIYKDKEIIKEVIKRVPMTPDVCQCGHGVCYHLRGDSLYTRHGECRHGREGEGRGAGCCSCRGYTEV